MRPIYLFAVALMSLSFHQAHAATFESEYQEALVLTKQCMVKPKDLYSVIKADQVARMVAGFSEDGKLDFEAFKNSYKDNCDATQALKAGGFYLNVSSPPAPAPTPHTPVPPPAPHTPVPAPRDPVPPPPPINPDAATSKSAE